MKQSLQLRLGQQLTMTPQLQQAIRMLQLSTLELQMEVQQALDSNMMLEIAEEGDEGDEASLDNSQASNPVTEEGELRGEPLVSDPIDRDNQETGEALSATEMPDELAVDSAWDDVYESSLPPSSAPAPADDRDFDYGDTRTESLAEHLIWQMHMHSFSEVDQAIAEEIIDAIGDDGFLTLSLEELHQSLLSDYPGVELDEFEAVLHAIQNFDPVGVAARDLRESLLLQLKFLDPATPYRNEALQLIDRHFESLAKRDYAQIKRRMKISEDDLILVIQLVQSLNPRPGGHISSSQPQYIVPDVFLTKVKGQWRVELNPEAVPRLRINSHYASLIKQVNNSGDSTTLKSHLQEARWFMKSLLSRNETLLRVSTSIIEHQREFFELGDVGMKPMVLHDIAEELEMHESTISRTTTRKYMHTPRGIFELKYFFSSHVSTASGGECSSTAIRALIKNLISEEQPSKPLSDNKIAALLSAQGINVARRTIAKYREAMAIPPSNERKRLA